VTALCGALLAPACALDVVSTPDHGPPADKDGGHDRIDARTDAGVDPDSGPAAAGTPDTGTPDTGTNPACSPPPPQGPCDPLARASLSTAWLPGALGSTLAVWLRPEGITFGPAGVVEWRDDSVHGNTGTPAGTAAPSRTGCMLNGRPGVHFSAGAIELADASSLQLGSDFTLFVVAAYSNSRSGILFDKIAFPAGYAEGVVLMASPGDPSGTFWGGLGAQLADPNFVPGGVVWSTVQACNDGHPRSYGVRKQGAQLNLYVKGTVTGSASLASGFDLRALHYGAQIGGDAFGAGQYLQGDIFEIVLVRAALTDAQIALLESYFEDGFGLR
jgi:hypothetical protein